MSIGRVYSKDDDKVIFICPFCGVHHEEIIPAGQEPHEKIITACPCGNTYTVQIESRKFYRKKTCLEGLYKKLTPMQVSGKIFVVDISVHGCRFDASIGHHLKPGDHIGVAFNLNDAQHRLIKKEAIVRSVEGRYVGCQFIVENGVYDPDLGFYLRSP